MAEVQSLSQTPGSPVRSPLSFPRLRELVSNKWRWASAPGVGFPGVPLGQAHRGSQERGFRDPILRLCQPSPQGKRPRQAELQMLWVILFYFILLSGGKNWFLVWAPAFQAITSPLVPLRVEPVQPGAAPQHPLLRAPRGCVCCWALSLPGCKMLTGAFGRPPICGCEFLSGWGRPELT